MNWNPLDKETTSFWERLIIVWLMKLKIENFLFVYEKFEFVAWSFRKKTLYEFRRVRAHIETRIAARIAHSVVNPHYL